MTRAVFFDGESARDHDVDVHQEDRALVFVGEGVVPRNWTLSDLHPIDPPAEGQPFRITHAKHPGQRLILNDQAFINDLLVLAPHLKKNYQSFTHFRQVLAWTAGGLAVLAGVGYLVFSLLPSWTAPLLPDDWTQRMGAQIEKSVASNAKTCTAPAGVAAFQKMLNHITKGDSDLPKVTLTVYDMDLLNAFATPGKRIMFTKEILQKADSPDEIAGVLAHEMGHVFHQHPEQQLVRVAGLQILMSAFSGSGSDTIGNVAGLAAILRYSREAEAEADSFARERLEKSAVDPTALKSFFEKLIKLENPGGTPTTPSALDRIGSVLSTHPDTRARIDAIKPLPANVTPAPSLTDDEWKALKEICSKTT